MMLNSRSNQSGVSLVIFAIFALILLMFAGLLIGIDGYYGSIQHLDAAGETGALASAQDLCQVKYNATSTFSIARDQAVNDVAHLLDATMYPVTASTTQTTNPSDCSDQTVLAAYTCPPLTPGAPGTIVYCLDFPADTTVLATWNSSIVKLHLLWVVQQPFSGIIGPTTLLVKSDQSAHLRIPLPPSPSPSPSSSGTFTYDHTVLHDGPAPTAYWKFNETSGATAADSSGNSNTLTWVGPRASSPTSPIAGQAHGFSFAGSSYLQTTARIDPAPGTVEYWARFTATPGANVTATYATNGNSVGNRAWFKSGFSACGVNYDDNYNPNQFVGTATCSTPPPDHLNNGSWHLFDLVCTSAGDEQIYQDAQLLLTNTAGCSTAGGWNASEWFDVGATHANAANGGGVSARLTGQLSNLAVYPSALSGTQIADRYSCATIGVGCV